MTKKGVGEERVYSAPKEVRTRTQAGQEPEADTVALAAGFLLTGFPVSPNLLSLLSKRTQD